MSRVGKKIINIPKDVTVLLENGSIHVKGPYGILEQKLLDNVEINLSEKEIQVLRKNDLKSSKACHGLFQVLIQNMVIGVSQKFSKNLIVEGIGYKFQYEKNNLILTMGFSHRINFEVPHELNIQLESPTKIVITGINKEKVGFFAAKIRDIKPPEPYKGKGIRYEAEIVRRKAGKTRK
jgi:large subunit ribosomal protein L6